MATTKKKQSVKQPVARPVRVNSGIKKPLLLHHRHSFKLVHYRHTSYPVLLFLLLMTGMFSVAWTSFAAGESYDVTAVVPAPPLPAAATIDTPNDGHHFTNQIITVSGVCPANSYVKLSRNHVFAGSSLCQSGAWSVQLSLQAGSNLLNAQAYNVTDQPGPASSDITVVYDPPPGAVVTANNDGAVTTPTSDDQPSTTAKPAQNKSSAAPLLLGANFTYKGYFTGQLSDWALTIGGGTAPYAVQIDWGDGQTDLKSLRQDGSFDMQHTYGQGSQNSYVIKITAEDADGQSAVLQLFTIISQQGSAGATNLKGGVLPPAGILSATDTVTPFQKFWRVAGPTYAVMFIAAGSFWLGESQAAAHWLRPRFWHWHGLHLRH